MQMITATWPQLEFTNTVGVAPGTYTLQLGAPFAGDGPCVTCPPDETGYYMTPPFGPYGAVEPTDNILDPIAQYSWDPYANDAALSGLRGRGFGDDDSGVSMTGIIIGVLGLFGVIAYFAMSGAAESDKRYREKGY